MQVVYLAVRRSKHIFESIWQQQSICKTFCNKCLKNGFLGIENCNIFTTNVTFYTIKVICTDLSIQYSILPNAFQRLQNRLNPKGSSPTKNDLTFFVLKIVSMQCK